MHACQRLILIIAILGLLQALPATVTPSQAQTPEEDQRIAEMMSQMSVDDKVGQLFLVSFVGNNANPDSDIWKLITEYKVGGVILLAANSNFNNDPSAPRQIAELTNALKTTAFRTNGLPLFVAVDHEGDGYPYTRITGGTTPIPSPMAIGATWDTANAEAVGQRVGEELSAMGINMLLGPGLDVLKDPHPSGQGDIGTRVFGGDPYWVSQMGRAYIRGIHQGSQGHMLTVAKHFPGHGGSDRLPDNEVATVDKSLQELRRIELPPFFHVTAKLPEDGLGQTDALMSSHIRYRGFQGDIRQFTAPISFDANGMSTLLSLPEIAPWYEDGGLIISDALGVPAVRKHFDPTLETFPHRRIAKEAFLAGNDVLSLVQFDLKSSWPDQFANIKDTIFFFRTEYLSNPAFAAQVDAAVARILRLKLKLYPELTLDTLNVDPNQAILTGQPQTPVLDIAREGMTLLYPSPEEVSQRIPQPPRPDETILVITDVRLARECFSEECKPEELFIPRTAIEEMILRLYGPNATGQILPNQISSITFSELKLALGGIVPPEELAEGEQNPLIQLSADEVRQRIQNADWLIFASLDLNTLRYPDSDALKLFLAQESGTLLDKITVVLAFSAPYYLDTTEVTKLSAMYGIYSKTMPHIEAAGRALFGEATMSGASPVSVEGIGYELVDVLAPDPDQDLPIKLLDRAPIEGGPPVTVNVQAGPVIDFNGNIVPDGTPVEIRATEGLRQIASQIVPTTAGFAETEFILREPGEIEISAIAGQATSSDNISILIANPSTPTPTNTPTPPTVTTVPSATLEISTPTTAPTKTPLIPAWPGGDTPSPSVLPDNPRTIDAVDLMLAAGAIVLGGILGFWLGQHFRKPLSRRVRIGLWAVVGGLAAYLLYGMGWLRPELWLLDNPDPLAGRLSIVGLVFLFSAVTAAMVGQIERARSSREN
jgi:beta-N-acetylhexosaminidase